jgi:hypothetical protein
MSVEEDIRELKTDIKWIKKSIEDIHKERQLSIGYLVGIVGSVIISITSLALGLMR